MSKKDDKDSSSSVIWIGDIDQEAAVRFHSEAWQMFMEDPTSPIVIEINSFGGDIYALLDMMETMDSIRLASPEQFFFLTHAKAAAMSCGLSLLAHGDLRVANPNATLMFHELAASSDQLERLHQKVIMTKELERLAILLDQIFIEDTETHLTLEELKQWGEKDRYLDAWEAKDFGIIDVIGAVRPPTVTINPISVIDLEDRNQFSFRKTRENKSAQTKTSKKKQSRKK